MCINQTVFKKEFAMSDFNTVKGLSATSGTTNIKDMSIGVALAYVELEVAKTHKENASKKIEEMQAANERAKQINAKADKLRMFRDNLGNIPEYIVPTTKEGLQKDLETVQKLKKILNDEKNFEANPDGKTYKLKNDEDYKMLKELTARVGNNGNGTGPFANLTRGGNDNAHFKNEIEDGLKELEKYETVLGALIEVHKDGLLPTGFNKLNSDTISSLIESIQHTAESANANSQTEMIKLQDIMGQYNSMVSGASDNVKNANNITRELAKN